MPVTNEAKDPASSLKTAALASEATEIIKIKKDQRLTRTIAIGVRFALRPSNQKRRSRKVAILSLLP